MKKELIKKLYLKEVVTILLFILSVSIYLNIPFKTLDLYDIGVEEYSKFLTEDSLFLEKDIDFSMGFKNSFRATLPFSQIIEYKKQKFIYNLALYNNDGKQIPKDIKSILVSTNMFYSLKEITPEKSISKYTFYQFLGVMSVLFVIMGLYFIVKFRRPSLLNYYYFILILFYLTNYVFLSLKSDKEKLIEKTLKESYVNKKLN